MSNGEMETAHVRSLPSDYVDVQDQSYDPNYISDISKKMQVPDRICVDDGSGAAQSGGYFDPGSGRQIAIMNVPDRIIVAGDNQHIGLREGMRKLPMDQELPYDSGTLVELTTPPRVLTLEQCFPIVEDSDIKQSKETHERQLAPNGHLAASIPYTPGVSPNDSLLLNEEDEATLLRTQVAKLTRRVTLIEQDSQRRAQREMGLYIALVGYAIWKLVFSVFHR